MAVGTSPDIAIICQEKKNCLLEAVRLSKHCSEAKSQLVWSTLKTLNFAVTDCVKYGPTL